MSLFLNDVIGYPPSTHVSDAEIVNSMPVVEITPCEPNFEAGLTLFLLNEQEGWQNYTDILRKHGTQDFTFSPPSNPLKFAYIAENFPNDTFTNEYGETFLQKMTDVVGQGVSELIQMTGAKNAFEAGEKLGKGIEKLGGATSGMLGEAMRTGGGKLISGAQGASAWMSEMQSSDNELRKMVGGGLAVAAGMLAGHRIDFPMIWRNSAFTPSYSLTIRLWNPNPSSETSTLKYIIYPLTVILCLGLPRTKGGFTFRYPFFHKVVSRGIFTLDPAVITNINVVKGGDQQQIAHSQFLGMVDVRIDFAGLFTSMVMEEGDQTVGAGRPTLVKYIAAMTQKVQRKSIYTRDDLRRNSSAQAGVSRTSSSPEISRIKKNEQLTVTLPKPTPEETRQRVLDETKELEKKLEKKPEAREIYPEYGVTYIIGPGGGMIPVG